MLRHLFLMLLLLGFFGEACAQRGDDAPIPASLVHDGELVDVEDGFAIRVDQPDVTWSVVNPRTYAVSYIGVDRKNRTVYTVFVDRRRYGEMQAGNADEYLAGTIAGDRGRGWTIASSTVSPASAPRRNSYCVRIEGTLANVAVSSIDYVTSPAKLYSVSVTLPKGGDEQVFRSILASFRLLEK